MRGERGRAVPGGLREFSEPAGLRVREHQRPVFGADGVVWRRYARLADARKIGSLAKIEDGVAGAKFQHEPFKGAVDVFGTQAACATDDRCDGRNRRGVADRAEGGDGSCIARDEIFRERDHRDHALIGLARGCPERDDAVFAENEAVVRPAALEYFDRLLRQTKSGHQIRHVRQPAAKNLRAFLFAVRLVDDAEHRRGVGVVDERMRQKRVQHDLDRRIGR